MGACDFDTTYKGMTAQNAFNQAVADAAYEHGHGGYSGTIAEKQTFTLVKVPEGITADEFVEQCMADENHVARDKWGPAACIDLGGGLYRFFGLASS